jgi:hypothetical protein
LDYPADFETPAFPAGKKLALSRVFSIGILAALPILIFLCALLVWTARSQRLSPIIIAPDWTIVGRAADRTDRDMIMQESVALNFARAWFEVSQSADNNEANWCRVLRDECNADEARPCTIYCAAGEDLYDVFLRDVLPDYRVRARDGKILRLLESSATATPEPGTDKNGGIWKLRARVTDGGAPFEILAFVKIAKNAKHYPTTLGYYVADFNSYRMQ